MTLQYETPMLHRVGHVAEVVLGLITPGYDIDGTAVVDSQEFEDDFSAE